MKKHLASLYLTATILSPMALANSEVVQMVAPQQAVEDASEQSALAELCTAMAEARFADNAHAKAAYQAELMTLPEAELMTHIPAVFDLADAVTKTRILKSAMTMTQYETLPDLMAPNVKAFAKKRQEVEHAGFISPEAILKSAHTYGSAATVAITAEGDVPEAFQGLEQGLLRLAPGTPGKMPAYSIAMFGDGDRVVTRVFASTSGTSYDAPIGQTILNITVAGEEGPCICTADSEGPLAAINVCQDPRPLFNEIPAGTVLARLTSEDPDANWSLTITSTSPMTSNHFADGHLRFQRKIRAVNWMGSLALKALGTLGFFAH